MNEQDSRWDEEDFEAHVSAGLIACFETKLRKSKDLKILRLTDNDLVFMRKNGVFFPGNERVIIGPGENNRWGFDTDNDPFPVSGTFAMRNWRNKGQKGGFDGYVSIIAFKRIPKIPSPMITKAKGTHYELSTIIPGNQRVEGFKWFLTVTPDGEIFSADSYGYTRNGPYQKKILQSEWEPALFAEREGTLSVALQYNADRRFAWSITAVEGQGKVILGCGQEEIKSLLYARSLPQTETGRKKPIIHLIESHKRRRKNGTEIDIVPFLRGIQTVEIGGTMFTVNPPLVRKPDVSEASKERYYATP